jgi:diketogulonate reductase-like aldo/keto reductase
MLTKSGKKVFPIGIGTWDIASQMSELKEGELFKGVEPIYGNEEIEIGAIRYSISLGQNHIDTAELYGRGYTEQLLAKAINDLPREELFIADKLWKNHVETGAVTAGVDGMLERLRTSYIDLLYIHAPWDGVNWIEAVSQIDDLIDAGFVRYLGLSNVSIKQIKQVQALSRHGVSAVQQRLNIAYRREATKTYRQFCKDQGIQLVAYHPINRNDLANCKEAIDLSKKLKITLQQAALLWLLEKDIWQIPKSTNKSHILQNFNSTKFLI